MMVGVLGASLIAGCGGSGDSSSEPSGSAADADTEVVATLPDDDAVSDAGDSGSEASLPPVPEYGDGSCDVSVTGDKQVEWSGGGTLADVGASYWYGDVERDLGLDGFTIILNCGGDDGDSLSFASVSTADESSVPQGPGTYQLTTSTDSDLFVVLLQLVDSETNWRVADPGGTLTITEFDDDSIAGTFEFPMEDSLAEISGDPSEGAIMVTGNFDFNRPPSP